MFHQSKGRMHDREIDWVDYGRSVEMRGHCPVSLPHQKRRIFKFRADGGRRENKAC